MQRISNSVKQRLGAKPQPAAHPEPDVLNAYMERVLPSAERNEVVRHLADCDYCREVVSLSLSSLSLSSPSLPQSQAEPALQGAFSRSRFWVPAFRLGAAVAVLAVAATMVIEKPWWTGPGQKLQPSQVVSAPQVSSSQVAQTPQASNSPQTSLPTNGTAVPAPLVAAGEIGPLAAPGGSSSPTGATRTRAAGAEPSAILRGTDAANIAAPAPRPLGVVAGMSENAPLSALPPQSAPAVTNDTNGNGKKQYDSGTVRRDYLNTNALPPAPAPQGSNMSSRQFPAVSMDQANDHAFDFRMVVPTTVPTPATGPADPTTLKTSSGFMRSTKRVVVVPLEKATRAAGEAARFAAGPFTGRYLKPLDLPSSSLMSGADLSVDKAAIVPQWKISDGMLMKSTDSTQWHEAYPQASDLQLKVVVPREGDQVWAGGNNGTIIHSWNGGVNWETLKVPDSGDITSITVDDGWQVRTSNGQTFVSQDHGKTWTPLEAQPK